MKQSAALQALVWIGAAVILAGCRPAGDQPAKSPPEQSGRGADDFKGQPARETKSAGLPSEKQPAGEIASQPAAEQVSAPASGEASRPSSDEASALEPAAAPKPAGPDPAEAPGEGIAEAPGEDIAKAPARPGPEAATEGVAQPPDKPAAAEVYGSEIKDAFLQSLENPPEATPEQLAAEAALQQAEKARDLGPPLVDNLQELTRLDKQKPVWVDGKNKRVVLVGEVCQTDVPLEMFACLKNTLEHEAIVAVDTKAFVVHAGLLAVGAKVGNPVQFNPTYVPASGTEIEVTVVWKDKNGQRKTARAQDWIYDSQAKKAMSHQWVFAGSMFWEDEKTGQRHYQGEAGYLICVSNFASATLDLPIQSSDANSELMFKAYTERIPPRGTPVTLLLTPRLAPGEKEEANPNPFIPTTD